MEKVKPWLGEPQNTIAVLQKYGFVFQKKYGQNFLIDPHVLDKIVAAAGIGPDDFVVEIGPGIGTLTQYLAYAARSVCAVEIDKNHVITALTVDASGEFYALGGKCADEAFTSQFIGKSAPLTLGVDIDAVTGATLTSQAVVDAVNQLAK